MTLTLCMRMCHKTHENETRVCLRVLVSADKIVAMATSYLLAMQKTSDTVHIRN